MKDMHGDTINVGDYVMVLREYGSKIPGGSIAVIVGGPSWLRNSHIKIKLNSSGVVQYYRAFSLIKQEIEDLI